MCYCYIYFSASLKIPMRVILTRVRVRVTHFTHSLDGWMDGWMDGSESELFAGGTPKDGSLSLALTREVNLVTESSAY